MRTTSQFNIHLNLEPDAVPVVKAKRNNGTTWVDLGSVAVFYDDIDQLTDFLDAIREAATTHWEEQHESQRTAS